MALNGSDLREVRAKQCRRARLGTRLLGDMLGDMQDRAE